MDASDVLKMFGKHKKQDEGKSDFARELENASDVDLEAMHETHKSNIHIKREWEKRQKK